MHYLLKHSSSQVGSSKPYIFRVADRCVLGTESMITIIFFSYIYPLHLKVIHTHRLLVVFRITVSSNKHETAKVCNCIYKTKHNINERLLPPTRIKVQQSMLPFHNRQQILVHIPNRNVDFVSRTLDSLFGSDQWTPSSS